MNKNIGAETPKTGAPVQLVPFPVPRAAVTPARSPNRRLLIGGAIALAVLAGVAAAWWLSSSSTTVRYATALVTRGAVTRTVTATGTVNPVLTIIVGTYVSGVIQELSCDYNTQVKRGQICAKIDPRPYQSVVDQSRANLAIAKAQLEKDKASLAYAKLNYDRQGRLIKTQAVSQDTFDIAKNAYEQAQAQITFDEATIQQRQAALDAALVNLDYTNIISPVDGIVVSRNVTMGQTVAASFQTPTLFLIATDLTKMQVDTNVSESDIGSIKEGNTAIFTVDAFPKRTFNGAVIQIRQSPQTVQNVVTFDVVIGADNSELAMKPGMTAATRIVTDQRTDVTRVPNQALRYRPSSSTGPASRRLEERSTTLAADEANQAQLWLLRDGQTVSTSVVIGLEDDSFTEIVQGDVKPGDRVIIGEQSVAGDSRSVIPRLRL
jgi:HlyD family secretion protein